MVFTIHHRQVKTSKDKLSMFDNLIVQRTAHNSYNPNHAISSVG